MEKASRSSHDYDIWIEDSEDVNHNVKKIREELESCAKPTSDLEERKRHIIIINVSVQRELVLIEKMRFSSKFFNNRRMTFYLIRFNVEPVWVSFVFLASSEASHSLKLVVAKIVALR